MSDRLTQLQDAVTQQAEHFYNSIGILQQCAPPSSFPGVEKAGGKSASPPPQEDYAHLFAKMITRTAKDIDVLIDNLPSEDSSTELQPSRNVFYFLPKVASLMKLEMENEEAAKKLEEIVAKGEQLLKIIQKSLEEIAASQLHSQGLESNLAK